MSEHTIYHVATFQSENGKEYTEKSKDYELIKEIIQKQTENGNKLISLQTQNYRYLSKAKDRNWRSI